MTHEQLYFGFEMENHYSECPAFENANEPCECDLIEHRMDQADECWCDGEPPDIDDDSHYDPYTGGDDFLREHGEDCYDW